MNVHLAQDRDERIERRKQELPDEIAKGLNSLERGEEIDGGEFFAQLEEAVAALEQSRAGSGLRLGSPRRT